MESLDFLLIKTSVDQVGDDSLEILFLRLLAKDLSRLGKAQSRRAESYRNSGGAETGKTSAGHRAFDFNPGEEFLIGLNALFARDLAFVDDLAEGALVFVVLGQAPFLVHSHEAERQPSCEAEGVFVTDELIRGFESIKDNFFKNW